MQFAEFDGQGRGECVSGRGYTHRVEDTSPSFVDVSRESAWSWSDVHCLWLCFAKFAGCSFKWGRMSQYEVKLSM